MGNLCPANLCQKQLNKTALESATLDFRYYIYNVFKQTDYPYSNRYNPPLKAA